jgi:aromatic-L-amino-acid decarboxylase
MADITRRHNIWLHVDAAYAGTAAMLPEFRHILKGVERADSLVVNPHKWMLVPVDISAFYTRRPEILRRAFSLVPEYLRTQEDPRAVNLMDYSLSLGRRFRALKLWFVMRYFGREGIERILRSHIAMAHRLAEIVDQDPQFERLAPAPFSVVCFRYKGSDDENRAILDKVNASGKAYISHTSLKGQVVLRIAIGNMGTTWEDVQQAWELIRSAAKN